MNRKLEQGSRDAKSKFIKGFLIHNLLLITFSFIHYLGIGLLKKCPAAVTRGKMQMDCSDLFGFLFFLQCQTLQHLDLLNGVCFRPYAFGD